MNIYFLVPLVLCTIYALTFGGAPERLGASAFAFASVGSHLILINTTGRWQGVEFGVFIVDALLFLAFLVIAWRADRFWPVWISALLGLGVLGHIVRWAGADVFWWAYAVVLTIWSYPILGILVIGTFCHQRRLRRHGSDASWLKRSAHTPPPSG